MTKKSAFPQNYVVLNGTMYAFTDENDAETSWLNISYSDTGNWSEKQEISKEIDDDRKDYIDRIGTYLRWSIEANKGLESI